jgi:hypothetical protein
MIDPKSETYSALGSQPTSVIAPPLFRPPLGFSADRGTTRRLQDQRPGSFGPRLGEKL